jgi:hypothetical protein
MAFVKSESRSLFSKETYQVYLEQKRHIINERLRAENETFFDAMLSEEADLTKTPEGREILDFIAGYK